MSEEVVLIWGLPGEGRSDTDGGGSPWLDWAPAGVREAVLTRGAPGPQFRAS